MAFIHQCQARSVRNSELYTIDYKFTNIHLFSAFDENVYLKQMLLRQRLMAELKPVEWNGIYQTMNAMRRNFTEIYQDWKRYWTLQSKRKQ